MHSYFNKEQAEKLHIERELVADAVNKLGTKYLDGVEDDSFRFTVVDEGVMWSMTQQQMPKQWKITLTERRSRKRLQQAMAVVQGTHQP